LIVDTALTLRL